jgi:hypothetical protein
MLRRVSFAIWHIYNTMLKSRFFLLQFVTSIGKSVARGLGFQSGSWRSSYTQVYVAFLVSALLHVTGDAAVGMQYFGSSFWFFIAQAVAITAEDAVIGIARRATIKMPASLAHAIGYIWVFIWFSLSCPWFLNWQVAAGLGLSEAVPVAPVRYAVGMLNETMGIDLALHFPK